MKKPVVFLIMLMILLCMLCTGCGGGPLDESEVVGDYGAFECESDNIVWTGCPYVEIYWKVTDPDNYIVTFRYLIEDVNIECFDEDYWGEYQAAGFENPEDALEEYMDEIVESFDLPSEGDYKYERSEKRLVSVDGSEEYSKKE